ncbi:MAG TPA: alcohol dehydrogenase catalytic domain-containing protein [Phycisphaerae bacterium]|nr:alcohol dehydrogenase catalytic domain-containing protein [Phycisphaerae bacterium]
MKVAYLTGIRQVEIREAPQPAIERGGEVLLKIDTVGVCGSDMHYFRTGRIGDQVVEFPFIVGHECSATVAKVAPGVKRVKVGDRVAVDPLVSCGRCDQCRAGREHTCRNQKFLGCPGQAPGCLAEYIVMPEACCYPVPEAVDSEGAVMTEPMAIGLYARRLSGCAAGAKVGILGAGPIGLCVLLACRAAGAEAAYVTEIRDYRGQLARRLGADWTGNPRRQDIVKAVIDREPEGLDVVFECAGEQSTLDEAVALARPGGKVMMLGIPEVDRVSVEVAAVRRKEVTLQPVRRQSRCVEDAIGMIASGKADVRAMVTHRYGLDQTQQAFETIADYRDNAVKAMIHVAA